MEVPGSASLDHKRLKLSTSSTVWILFFSKKKDLLVLTLSTPVATADLYSKRDAK